jgi:hypothetical protein
VVVVAFEGFRRGREGRTQVTTFFFPLATSLRHDELRSLSGRRGDRRASRASDVWLSLSADSLAV